MDGLSGVVLVDLVLGIVIVGVIVHIRDDVLFYGVLIDIAVLILEVIIIDDVIVNVVVLVLVVALIVGALVDLDC